jgi:hypothetical protein
LLGTTLNPSALASALVTNSLVGSIVIYLVKGPASCDRYIYVVLPIAVTANVQVLIIFV